MSKELTIFPKLPRTPGPGTGWADLRRDQDRECQLAHDKRFSDAELAAEFEAARCDYLLMQHTGGVWTPLGETWPMNPQDTGHRVGTLHRFATAPHYYESEIEAAA